jgi:hypothetical protein
MLSLSIPMGGYPPIGILVYRKKTTGYAGGGAKLLAMVDKKTSRVLR